MRNTCLVKRWKHHTPSGGYDRLAQALGAMEVRRSAPQGVAWRVAKKLWYEFSTSRKFMLDYQFGDWLAEQRIIAKCLVDPPDVVHVLYGDEQLNLLLRWRKLLRCPLVATFHLPADRVIGRFERFRRQDAERIDATIVLATSEIPQLERCFGADKVVYVPHGIDTFRFRPGERQLDRNGLKLIVVGEHMRDWNVMHRVIDEAHRNRFDVHFDVVTRPEFFPYFTGCSNITLHSAVPECEFIKLYQEADALFLPVTNAVACNAVLEALACGTPVIATDVGGMRDYVTSECGWLIPRGDVFSAVDILKQLSTDRDKALSLRENSRAQALKFDWQRVAERIMVVYSAVQLGRSPSTAVKEFERTKYGIQPGSDEDNRPRVATPV